MRFDYFCPVWIHNRKGQDITKVKTLQKLHGYVDREEGADFTEFMEDELEHAELIGDPLTLVYVPEAEMLFARVGFYPKDGLSDNDIAELTEYVVGQFIDGYGSAQLEFRKGLSRYRATFAAYTPMELPPKAFTPYPFDSGHAAAAYTYIRGPFAVNAPRPSPKAPRIDAREGSELARAAVNGDFETVKKLVLSGAKIDAFPIPKETYDTSMSALGWAANRAHMDMLDFLLAHGANPNVKTSHGDTPLMIAADGQVVSRLLAAGADPMLKNEQGLDAAAFWEDQLSFYQHDGDENWANGDVEASQISKYQDQLNIITVWKKTNL